MSHFCDFDVVGRLMEKKQFSLLCGHDQEKNDKSRRSHKRKFLPGIVLSKEDGSRWVKRICNRITFLMERRSFYNCSWKVRKHLVVHFLFRFLYTKFIKCMVNLNPELKMEKTSQKLFWLCSRWKMTFFIISWIGERSWLKEVLYHFVVSSLVAFPVVNFPEVFQSLRALKTAHL